MEHDRAQSYFFIINQIKFHLVQNRIENCRYDHICFLSAHLVYFFRKHLVILSQLVHRIAYAINFIFEQMI